MKFTLYSSDVLGRKANCLYPHKIAVTDEASLKAAVSHDYVSKLHRFLQEVLREGKTTGQALK